MRIKIKVESKECEPVKTHRNDAGWDLKTNKEFTIKSGEMYLAHTGVNIAIPKYHFGMICVRSSLGKKGVTMTNSIGVIDTDYRGELMVNLINNGSDDITIEKFDRFAQLVIIPFCLDALEISEYIGETERGEGGFGSTTESLPNPREEVKEESSADNTMPLKSIKPSEYIKLKNSGKLMDIYPDATGDIKEDLEV